MAWDTSPPLPRTRLENWPTLLFSWWCTAFSAAVILNVLFREDWVMMAALVPLFIRMAFIHVVLIWGTNNVQTVGYSYTAAQIRDRSIGSRLVLCARIFYAMYIWICKLTVSEFLKRITVRTWRRSYEMTLQGIRIFLLVTFIAVVLATLTECQPFHEYWQVVPEAKPACRLGYAQLITMGACDIITDILLVAFPIPIVLRSGQNWKRKLQLALLFSLSVVMIAVTGTRVPEVIRKHGRQQYRSVWASCEILAATATTNMIIIGSFLRDKGTKKNKYRSQSVTDSMDISVRRPTHNRRAGSEEDLFRELGLRVPQHLLDDVEPLPRPAPAALSAKEMKRNGSTIPRVDLGDGLPPEVRNGNINGVAHHNNGQPLPSPAPSTKRSVSFFDVGGLLEESAPSWDTHSRSTTLAGSGTSGVSAPVAQDFAAAFTSHPEPPRRGSRAFLSDIGGILTPTVSRNGNNNSSYSLSLRRQPDSQHPPQRHRTAAAPIGVLGPMLERQETQFSLQDAGGLLAEEDDHHDEDDVYMSPALRSHDEDVLPQTHPQEGASATAVSGSSARPENHRVPAGATAMTTITNVRRRGEAYNELELHDPGGLLSRD